MPSKKKREKTTVCIHHEQVIGTVGTCLFCRQVRDYRGKPHPFILERGQINGVLTDIHPPDKIIETMTRSYTKRAIAPTIKVALGS